MKAIEGGSKPDHANEQELEKLREIRISLLRLISKRSDSLEELDGERGKWDNLAEDYENNVYSITKFPEKRDRILSRIKYGDRILIAGCGSEVYLQQDLLKACPDGVQIIASDYSPKMLKVSRAHFSGSNLQHQLLDTRELPFKGEMTKIISTNSIVPPSRGDILRMYRSIFNSLETSGEFIAYFPSFSSLLKMAEERPELLEYYASRIDFNEFRFNDTVGWQCWQTSLTLGEELEKAGFLRENIKIESIGCESPSEVKTLSDIYSIDEDFIGRNFECFFVTAKK